MSEFDCPKCNAKNRPSHQDVGCRACGFGKHEHAPRPGGSEKVEAPPGFSGKYLTEDL